MASYKRWSLTRSGRYERELTVPWLVSGDRYFRSLSTSKFFYFSIVASRTVITLVTLQCLDQEVLVAVEQNPTNINGWVIKLHSTGTEHLQLAILKIRGRLGRSDVVTKCIMGLFWGKLSPILCAGTWVKTRDNSQTSSLPMTQFKYNTVLRNGQKVTGFGFRMIWKMLQISEGVTTSLFRLFHSSSFPCYCYLKYPQNKRSRARDWGKGNGWKRVWASPTYRDSSTFKIRSFPTSNSPKVPKVGSLKWWIFLNSLFDPTYNFFNVLYFFNFVCRAPKQHKNCRPKNSCEVKSFLFSYELVYGASIMIQIKV